MRLTQEMRSKIQRSLLEYTFAARWNALAKRESELAFKVRDHSAGSHLEALLALPARFVVVSTEISIKVGEADLFTQLTYHPERTPHRSWDRHGRVSEPTPARVVQVSAGHNLGRSAVALDRDWRALWSDISDIRSKVVAALGKATTVKKLIEEWPEIEPFVPANVALPNLPAIPAAELNARIEEARAA